MQNWMQHGTYSNTPMKNNIHLQKRSIGKKNKKIFPFLLIIVYFYSRSIWEANVAIIRKHNLEADIGLHTYTLGMNKFGDMVGFQYFF
jgi:hypothetical protein